MRRCPRIFVVVEFFVPGFKAGGPLRSIANLIAALGRQFEFYVYTRDRDEDDHQPFSQVRRDCWQDFGAAKVFYASPRHVALVSIARAIKAVGPDAIYLNSAFAPMSRRVLGLRRLGVIRNPIVIAPRNELSPGALSLKWVKKRLFLLLAKRSRLYEGLLWQCSNEEEASQVRTVFPRAAVVIACDVAAPLPELGVVVEPKAVGSARLVYLSRISPKKNLLTALRALRGISGTVTFDIYGPIQDEEYWRRCVDVISSMPSNIAITYKGAIPPERVREQLRTYQFFILPTLGENFGHAIQEALSVGLPVLVGPETPWSVVAAAQAGWIVESDVAAWRAAIAEAVATNAESFRVMSVNARHVAEKHASETEAIRANEEMLNRVATVS